MYFSGVLNLRGDRGSRLRHVVSVQFGDDIGWLVVLLGLVQDDLDLAEDAEEGQEGEGKLEYPMPVLAKVMMKRKVENTHDTVMHSPPTVAS